MLLLVLALAGAHPLSLAEATQLATERAASMQRAEIGVEQAQLQAFRAQLDRVSLTIDGHVTELFNKANVLGPTPPGSPNLVLGLSNLQAQLSVPLFTGFQITRNVERTQVLERASRIEVDVERRRIKEVVARAYWGIRRLMLLKEARDLALVRLGDSERVVTARIAAGLAPAIDKNRATQRRLQLEASILDVDGSITEQSADLAALLGLNESVTLTDALDVDTGTEVVVDAQVLTVNALGTRPEVLAARAVVQSREAEVAGLYGAFYPQLAAFAQAQLGNNPTLAGAGVRSFVVSPNPFAQTTGDVQVGLTLSMNFFDTLHTLHNAQAAEQRVRLAQAELRGVQQSIEQDIAREAARVTAIDKRRPPLRALRDAAKENLDVIERSYQRGDAVLLDLLDATAAYADAQAQAADLDAQWMQARALLALVADVDTTTATTPSKPTSAKDQP